jgi:hypothetical protein
MRSNVLRRFFQETLSDTDYIQSIHLDTCELGLLQAEYQFLPKGSYITYILS